MGLFENYENIPSSYIPNNMCPPRKAPCIPKAPLVQYNAKGEFVGYTWAYGDEVNLEFRITGDIEYDDSSDEVGFYETVEDYLEGKYCKLTLFNFRGEAIWAGWQNASSKTLFYIDRKCSENLLPGIYRCKLVLYEDMDSSVTEQTTFTLVNLGDYIFTVK